MRDSSSCSFFKQHVQTCSLAFQGNETRIIYIPLKIIIIITYSLLEDLPLENYRWCWEKYPWWIKKKTVKSNHFARRHMAVFQEPSLGGSTKLNDWAREPSHWFYNQQMAFQPLFAGKNWLIGLKIDGVVHMKTCTLDQRRSTQMPGIPSHSEGMCVKLTTLEIGPLAPELIASQKHTPKKTHAHTLATYKATFKWACV